MSLRQVSTFTNGHFHLAIDTKYVMEVSKPLFIESIPLAQPWVEGLCSLRGRLVSVVNLSKLLGINNIPTAARFIILENDQQAIALTVDSVGSIAHLDSQQMQNTHQQINTTDSFFSSDVFEGIIEHEMENYHIINAQNLYKFLNNF